MDLHTPGTTQPADEAIGRMVLNGQLSPPESPQVVSTMQEMLEVCGRSHMQNTKLNELRNAYLYILTCPAAHGLVEAEFKRLRRKSMPALREMVLARDGKMQNGYDISPELMQLVNSGDDEGGGEPAAQSSAIVEQLPATEPEPVEGSRAPTSLALQRWYESFNELQMTPAERNAAEYEMMTAAMSPGGRKRLREAHPVLVDISLRAATKLRQK